jgi:hypothetical protein
MFAPARVDAGHFMCRIQLNAAPLKSEKFCCCASECFAVLCGSMLGVKRSLFTVLNYKRKMLWRLIDTIPGCTSMSSTRFFSTSLVLTTVSDGCEKSKKWKVGKALESLFLFINLNLSSFIRENLSSQVLYSHKQFALSVLDFMSIFVTYATFRRFSRWGVKS